VINLTSVQVLDIETGTLAPVTVGFAPDQVLYAADSARAVVLSQSRVAVIDLASSPPKTEVIFPLTLSADQVVTPIGVSLTPDGRYALIPVAGSSDLYVLDLESHSINLISMSSSASDVAVNALNDRTVVVFAGRAAVDLIDHAFFDVDSIALDEPMRHIIDLGEQDLLWSHTGPRDVYRLDVATGNVVEYRMQSSPSAVHVAPGGSHAVIFTAGSGSGALAGLPGMEIIDLQDDRGRSTPYLLESPGVAVAWNDEAAGVRAMILQADAEYVYDLDLITGAANELPLPAPPTGLWRVPGGGFAMSLDASMGRVVFTDATGVETGQAEGFALLGGLDRPTVTVEVE
jgi:DNA-binding beta-propeller fold protein YncE